MRRIDARRRALIAAAARADGAYLGREFSFPSRITISTQMVGAMPGLPLGSADTLTILKSADSFPNCLFMLSRLSKSSDHCLRIKNGSADSYTCNDANVAILPSFRLALLDLSDPRIASFPGFCAAARYINAVQIAAFISGCVTVDRPTILFVPKRFADIEEHGFVHGVMTANSYKFIRKNGQNEAVTTQGTAFDYFIGKGEKICVWQPAITGG